MGKEQSLRSLVRDKALKLKANSKKNSFKALSFNVNHKTLEQVKAKANYLANKLQNDKDINFYLKCAWRLDEQTIDDILERSLRKDCGKNYFAKAAAAEMRRCTIG